MFICTVTYAININLIYCNYYFSNFKVKHDEYEKGVACIEETLANQTQELDELSKLSTVAFNRNTVLEREVRELRKRFRTAKSELQVCNNMYYLLL